jgi:hypothetical protein
MKTRAITALGAALALLAGPMAMAHHSAAMFDRAKTVTLDGTVKTFKWSNPHAWIELTVAKPGGATDTWNVEMTAPNNLMLEGWKRTTLKPGDKVSLTVNPLKDGKTGGLFVGVKLPDGKTLGRAGGQPRAN